MFKSITNAECCSITAGNFEKGTMTIGKTKDKSDAALSLSDRLISAETAIYKDKQKEEKIRIGARNAVENCARLKTGEKVVIITDKAAYSLAKAVYDECEKVTTGNIKIFVMEDFGNRSEDGSKPLPFPKEIENAMKGADVSFYMAGCKKGELESFRIPMLKTIKLNASLRHAHMPHITEEIMSQAMTADYSEIQKLSKKVYDIVSKSKKITVTGKNGSNFTVELNPKWKWIICDGLIPKGFLTNLPDGEVFTAAYNVPEGKMVIDTDMAIGDYFAGKYKSIDKTPVTIIIKDNKVESIQCDNKELLNDLKGYIKQDKYADKIAEFAIGTNIGLKTLIGNPLQDEKFPGVHFSLGDGGTLEDVTGGKEKCDESTTHLDLIMPGVTVTAHDENGNKTIIMQDGKFKI